MRDELKLRFTGVADLKPQVLRAKELAEIIVNFEAAIVATVVDQDPSIKREQIAVPLVAVQDESVGLVFAPNLPELTYRAAFRIVDAFATQQFHQLPQQALTPLRSLVRFVRSRGCVAELSIARAQRSATIEITPATRIETSIPIEGETVLFGEVVRVGGIEPKVELKPVNGKALFCATTAEIAVQLAGRLYQQVSVLGCAVWDYETWEIKEFQIKQVLPYVQKPISQAFRLLRESAAGAYDAVDDVEQYINQIRYDEDTN